MTKIINPNISAAINKGGPKINISNIYRNLYKFGYLNGSLWVNCNPGHPKTL